MIKLRRIKKIDTRIEVLGIDHGWSMMKSISEVFVTGIKAITTIPALYKDTLKSKLINNLSNLSNSVLN